MGNASHSLKSALDPQTMTALRFLAEGVDAKDPYTQGHMERVTRYSLEILNEIPENNTKENIINLVTAAMLHDIGKLRVPSDILTKPGDLNTWEFYEMQMHTVYCDTILGECPLADRIGHIIRAHHESVNGGGYPDGKKGEEIPMLSRIIAVADAFDAMTSYRPYRKNKKSDKEALEELLYDRQKGDNKNNIIEKKRNSKLDKNIVDAFIKAYEKCRISMARAFFYTEIRNPLAATGNEKKRPMLEIAGEMLEQAIEVADINSKKNKYTEYNWDQVKLKLLIRAATAANFQGKPEKALEYLSKTENLKNMCAQKYADRIAIQKAYALRELGKTSESAKIAKVLVSSEETWIKLCAAVLLAKFHVASKDLKKAEKYEKIAQKNLDELKSIAENENVFLLKQRWLNFDRIGWFDGMIGIARIRRLRATCDPKTEETVKQVIDLFEKTGYSVQASNVRVELAGYYADIGKLEDAVFLLRRELAFVEAVGNEIGRDAKSLLLGEVCSRYGMCLTDDSSKLQVEKEAIDTLNKCYRKTWIPDDIKRRVQACLALVCWRCRHETTAINNAVKLKKELKKQQGYKHMWENYICDFVISALNGKNGDGDLLQLGRQAAGEGYRVLAAEILAESIIQKPDQADKARPELSKLLENMNRQCWVTNAERYAEIGNL